MMIILKIEESGFWMTRMLKLVYTKSIKKPLQTNFHAYVEEFLKQKMTAKAKISFHPSKLAMMKRLLLLDR